MRSLAAFEKSEYADDWRELMRLYLVRRTRSFIQENYAKLDPTVNRKYLEFSDGTKSYFPDPRSEDGEVHDQRKGPPTTNTRGLFADACPEDRQSA